jgi:hypothetical protein
VEASGGKEEPIAVRGGAENWPFCDGKVNHDDTLFFVGARRAATRAPLRFA